MLFRVHVSSNQQSLRQTVWTTRLSDLILCLSYLNGDFVQYYFTLLYHFIGFLLCIVFFYRKLFFFSLISVYRGLRFMRANETGTNASHVKRNLPCTLKSLSANLRISFNVLKFKYKS